MANIQHSTMSGLDLHEDKRIKSAVRAASTANVSLSAPGTLLDGVTLVSGDRILLKDQTTGSQNGLYTWLGASTTLARTTDAASASDFVYGFKTFVREGTLSAASYWTFTQTASITLGTTSLTFAKDGAGTGSVTSVALAVPGELTVSGSPVTSSGTLTISKNQSASAAAVASNGTITTSGVLVARVSPTTAVTGVILQAGTYAGQQCEVVNEAVAANSVTFAASGTSNVANGSGSVITGLTKLSFVWDTATSLWYPAGGSATTLLTSNSNLIQETILTSAQATISIPNIPQGYRDLRVVFHARGDNATTEVGLQLQVNGDTGANYDSQQLVASGTTVSAGQNIGATSIQAGDGIPAVSAPSGAAGAGQLYLPDYTSTSFRKQAICDSQVKKADSAGNFVYSSWRGEWRNTSAITSLTIQLSAGNFAAGTVVRVYGEPAAAAGSSVGTGTRLRISANQSIASATATAVNWDTEDIDADSQHYTSTANLTGTVAKTAASATLVGTGTAFTTELSVGQVISVPGTATEVAVVIAIADATHLTTATAFANTASGQTAARLNSPIVFRQPGMFSVELGAYMAAIASGTVTVQLRLNGSTIIAQADKAAVNASAGYDLVTQRQFNQWDYVEALVTQASGGGVNLTADERTHLSVQSRPTVIVAIPYINIQDQKTSGTAGGTFTSGAWQTRTLNTTVSDTASLSSLATNQITLGVGTYRCAIRVTGHACDAHQARLQNITGAATLLLGKNAYASSGNAGDSYSLVIGRFTLTGSTALEVQHRCLTTRATDGFGVAASWGTEVYTVAEFWKEG